MKNNTNINLENYSHDEMFDAVSRDNDISFNELCTWLDNDENLEIIKDCLVRNCKNNYLTL